MLKEDFTKRLKDEKKATDGKDTGDKRMKNSPPAKKFKSWILLVAAHPLRSPHFRLTTLAVT
ncbi:22348_t:CDS:2 [Rhizophagus irregularis]|nr:22348_t:CDS:2 [Rhizophagus irregularis]